MRHVVRRFVLTLLLGQLLSVFTTGSGVFSQLLVDREGLDIPAFQGFCNYCLLALFYSPFLFLSSCFSFGSPRRRADYENEGSFDDGDVPEEDIGPFDDSVIQSGRFSIGATPASRPRNFLISLLPFFLLAFVDVEANYCAVTAYQFTNIASVMLLDCSSIPVTMLISFFFLKARYRWTQYVSVVLCLFGIIVLVVSDSAAAAGGSDCEFSRRWIGDLLCLCAGTLYACSMTIQQALLRNHGQIEVLALLGLFGTIIGGIQLSILEWREIPLAFSSSGIGFIFAFGFGVCLFLLYSFCPMTIRLASAAVVTLSFLTSNIYGSLVAVFLFQNSLSWFFILSLFLVFFGVILFTLEESRGPKRKDQEHYEEERIHLLDDLRPSVFVNASEECDKAPDQSVAEVASEGLGE